MSVSAASIPTNGNAARQSAFGASAECEWRLPSGEGIVAFALAFGFAAGPLAGSILGAGRPERRPVCPTARRNQARRS